VIKKKEKKQKANNRNKQRDSTLKLKKLKRCEGARRTSAQNSQDR
jgi:hypothetical protein